jgi:hypothetical protein
MLICKALRPQRFFNTIKIKNLALFAVKKTLRLKSTKHDKRDIANAPFHNAQNFCKSSLIVLQHF